MANFGRSVKKAGSKDSFMVVVWLLAIGLLLYFFKGFMSMFSKLMGDTKTDEQVQTEQQQKNDIRIIADKYASIYKKTSKPRDYFVNLANIIEQEFNKTKTDWAVIYNLIERLTDTDCVALYINFGTRMNYEGLNVQGDLPDWILAEDKMSPLDLFTKPKYLPLIKKKLFRLSTFIPAFKKLNPYA